MWIGAAATATTRLAPHGDGKGAGSGRAGSGRETPVAQTPARTPAGTAPHSPPGRVQFERLCARCHGAGRARGERGRGSVRRDADDPELGAVVRDGLPTRGMPGHPLAAADLQTLVAFVRTLRPGRNETVRATVTLADGGTVAGTVLNRSSTDMQVLADRGGLHLLRRAGRWPRHLVERWQELPRRCRGNRNSPLDQINPHTSPGAGGLGVVPAPGRSSHQVTPVCVMA